MRTINTAVYSHGWCCRQIIQKDFTDAVALLKATVLAVLDDNGFTRIQSLPAQNARKSASELLQWCCNLDNHSVLRAFAADLLHLFEQVLKTSSSKSQQKKRKNLEGLPQPMEI